MYLNLSPPVATNLLGSVKRLIEDYKAIEKTLPAGHKLEVVEERRKCLEIVRHRLEFGLGTPTWFEHDHHDFLKRLNVDWRKKHPTGYDETPYE